MLGPRSKAILRVLTRAEGAGNALREVSRGWSKHRAVFHMQKPICGALWEALVAEEPDLRCWSSPATPHNMAERGFTDDRTSEAVSFPA